MFEFLDTFWGGAVSFASGSLAIYGAVQAFSNKPKRLLYDFRSWSPSKVRVPEEFETRHRLAGNDFASIHITECIIKNETGAPITDTSFLHLPKVLLGNNNDICRVRRVLSLEDSRANFRSKDDSSEIELYDIMIPIESTLTIEIVSVEPIEKKVYCVHSDAKVEPRNYGRQWRSRNLYSIASLMLIASVWLISMLSALSDFTNPLRPLYDIHLAYFPGPLAALIVFLEIWAALLLAVFLCRKIMNLSESERRFTELKVNG